MVKVKITKIISERIKHWESYQISYGHSNHYILERLIGDPELSEKESILAVKAFLNNYEVEETDEEILLRHYKEKVNIIENSKEEKQKFIASGYISGTQDVLRIMGLKVNGINKNL